MKSYDQFLSAVVSYFRKHGASQAMVDKVETMLPAAWSANIIADALDIIQA